MHVYSACMCMPLVPSPPCQAVSACVAATVGLPFVPAFQYFVSEIADFVVAMLLTFTSLMPFRDSEGREAVVEEGSASLAESTGTIWVQCRHPNPTATCTLCFGRRRCHTMAEA